MRQEQTSQMTTMQSRARVSADQSASLSEERTSDLTSNGWLLALLLAWLCFASVGLYVWSWGAYDAFRALPVLDQFAAVTAFSVFALGFAATVREYRTDFMERWAARIVGAAGVIFLVAFAFRMTLTVDRLQTQIARKGSYESIPPVAQQIVDTLAQEPVTIETPSGRTVSWNGGSGSMSTANRRIGLRAIRYRDFADFVGPEDRRARSVSAAASGQPSTLSEF